MKPGSGKVASIFYKALEAHESQRGSVMEESCAGDEELRREVESKSTTRVSPGKLTQEQLAEQLNVRQPSIAKMERRADIYRSTLRGVIKAMGGEKEILGTRTLPLPCLRRAIECSRATDCQLCRAPFQASQRRVTRASELGNSMLQNRKTVLARATHGPTHSLATV